MAEVATGGLHDPQTLYRQWEDGQWSPWGVDLSDDRDQWQTMEETDRSLILWALASLMVAEERITTKFSGLVGAYGSAEEATFLSTQQVDEARHMQFYARFQDEVVADPASISDHVERARAQLSPAFGTIFDEELVEAHRDLVADPESGSKKIRFVATYHLIIESTLGLTAFHFITDYLVREGLLPGFVEGYGLIHHDEQRHIAYGVWFLQSAIADDPALADTVRETLRRMLPAVASSLAPPEGGETEWEALGASSDQIREFALGGLKRRLAIIGVPLESL